MPGALDGITVVDVGQLVQGPQAAALLCDMGAEVIKVELPGVGDLARWIFIAEDDQRSAYFTGSNRGKRAMTIDLRLAEGVSVFKRLIERADVMVSNFKHGTLESWGLGYEDLQRINPGLIWAAGSAFGPLGPDADREGADLAGQCAGGLISTIGRDDEPLSPVGVTIADHIASQHLASGILAALVSRGRTGQGQRVEVSLLGGQIWAQASEYTHYLMSGQVPGRANFSHPLLRGVYGIFSTKDGWIGIIGVPPASRDEFFIAVGHPELALDPRYLGLLTKPEDMRELFATLNPVFAEKTTHEWCEILRAMKVRYAPVNDYAQACKDPGLWANGYLAELTNQQGESVEVVGTPIRMSSTPLTPGAQAPELGEHTDDLLNELGFSAAEIEALKSAGAV